MISFQTSKSSDIILAENLTLANSLGYLKKTSNTVIVLAAAQRRDMYILFVEHRLIYSLKNLTFENGYPDTTKMSRALKVLDRSKRYRPQGTTSEDNR